MQTIYCQCPEHPGLSFLCKDAVTISLHVSCKEYIVNVLSNIMCICLFALWISTFLQNFITLCCLVFQLRDLEENKEKEEEKMNKTLYHSPIHV